MIWGGENWESFVPEKVYEELKNESPIDRRLMETAMLSRLRWLEADDFARVPDCAEGLHNRIFAAVQSCRTLKELLDEVKTKRYAMARLRRMLLCAALGVKEGMNVGVPGYIRVLAAYEKGLALLREMKNTSLIPIITKPVHGDRLEGSALECFRLGNRARAFYALGCGKDAQPDGDKRMGPYLFK